jgi:magnesium transporter
VKGDGKLALVLLLAMATSLACAGLVGTAVPLALRGLRLDPALGSGVVVTTFTDVIGFLTFLGLATLLLA